MKLALNALAAACLAAAAGPGFAAAYSSATFGNVTMTLIDLDPNDGVAASITFLPSPNKYDNGPYIEGKTESWAPFHDKSAFEHVANGQVKTLNDTTQSALATASASVTGVAGVMGFSAMSASGNAQSAVNGHGYYYSNVEVPYSYANNAFLLSAHTQVIFSAATALSANYTLGGTPGALEGESASSVATLYAGGQSADGLGWLDDQQQQYASVSFDIYGSAAPGPDSAAWNGLMSASYSNLSGHSANGEFYAQVSVSGLSVSAVPEPATYGMLLGGLGVLGALARRRRNA